MSQANPVTRELLRKANKEELLKMASANQVTIEQGAGVKEIRDILLKALSSEAQEQEGVSAVMIGQGDDDSLSFDQQLELKKLEFAEKEREFEREFEREKVRLDYEREKMRMEHDFRLKEREAGIVIGDNGGHRQAEHGFRLNDCYRSLPNFDEREVDMFFSQFERIALELKWPREYWHILVQSRFRGKASQAYNAMEDSVARNYDVLKTSVLRAYQLTGEAYRQQFRNLKKLDTETYCEFGFRKESLFDQWARAEKIEESFQKLRELVIAEEFKGCMSSNLRVHLEDQQISTLQEIAVAADNYTLIHKTTSGQTGFAKRDDRVPGKLGHSPNSRRPGFRGNYGNLNRSGGSGVGSVKPVQSKLPENSKSFKPKCSYCGMTNHLVANCFARQRDNEKVVGFVSHVGITSGQAGITSGHSPGVMAAKSNMKYVSQGTISEVQENSPSRVVTMFRDTGAWQSLIVQGAVSDPVVSATGRSIVLEMVGGVHRTVPLHKFVIQSDFVCGEVVMGVINELPIPGVDVLLGNDLTDRCCQSVCRPNLEISDCPSGTMDASQSDVYPACVMTRSMSRVEKARDSEVVDLADTCLFSEGESETSPSTGAVSKSLLPDVDVGRCSSTSGEQNGGVDKSQIGPEVNDTLGSQVNWDKEHLCDEQNRDVTLKTAWAQVVDESRVASLKEGFYVHQGVLMRKYCDNRHGDEGDITDRFQVVVPKLYRQEILSLAHDSLFAGHLGRTKTYDRLVSDFFWPGMYQDTEEFCKTCRVCQIAGKPNQVIPPAPLKIVPIAGEAFSKVQIDIVGPLPKTRKGHQYLLTVMCTTTRFPEALPLRKITAAAVANALIKYFTLTGLPNEIQSDQGSNFMSKLFQQVLVLLGIHQVRSSAYHPESQGALERFHQTLKSMLRCYCEEHEKDWDEGIPYVLFAARDAKQEALGFSPFDLVYGHTPKGPLKLVKAGWLNETTSETLLDYVSRIKDRLWQATELAKKHLGLAQVRIKNQFDKKAKFREFKAGDKVLMYLPIPKSSLRSKFFGPYTVSRRVSETGYVVNTPDRGRKTRFCHVNLLKAFHERRATCTVLGDAADEVTISPEETEMGDVKLTNSAVLADLDTKLQGSTNSQREDLKQLISEFSSIFSDTPSVTTAMVQDVDVQGAAPVKLHPYRMNPQKRDYLRAEIDYMLTHGIIEPSDSDWCSPCVLVPKADGGYRVAADLRQVNLRVKGDCHPLPRIDDCIDNIGHANFITKLDLLKGFYQIPLTERARRILTIVTPDGLYQYRVMPFGLKTAPAAFQRLMNVVLANIPGVEVYIDDVVIGSATWSDHLSDLRTVFSRIQQANLTVNLSKCEFGCARVTFLGHVVGLGTVAPVSAKVDGIVNFIQPSSRKEVRRFLGMTGYYRRFCPNFASVAAPLTDLLKKEAKFQWTEECDKSFQQLKTMLCASPVMAAPNFNKPFKLAVDASAIGAGAVLMQEDDMNIDHPVSYFSRKFNRHQLNYSTVEKEALGLVLALKHFEVYVRCANHTVIVFTDHNPLTFIHRMKDTNQRVLRWSLLLQEYPISIRHIKGVDNVIADALSRA